MSKISTIASPVGDWQKPKLDSGWKIVNNNFLNYHHVVPRVLIVHLKRFTHLGTKLKTPLNFPEFFSFDSDYILDNIALIEQKHAYKLYAIIVH